MAATGLEALDNIAGGLAEGRAYIAYGPIGSGKTTFALQFLNRGLLAGEEAAIVTRRSAQAVFDHGRTFGFELESFARERRFVILEYVPRVVENSIRLRDEERIFQELQAVLDDAAPRRLVFDPVTPLLTTGSASASTFRARTVFQSLSSLGASTLLMFDTPEGEEYVASCKDFAHGVLQFAPAGEGRSRLQLERFTGAKGRPPQIEFEVIPGFGLMSQIVATSAGGATVACSVLLAEPDAVQRDAVKGLLGKSCTVIDAEDGADVLAKVAVKPPNLVIMDADAEGVDGVTLCKRLRQNGLGVPVLLLSNPIRRTRDRVAIMASGADDVIERPFDGRIFKLKVQALLRRTLGGAVEKGAVVTPQRDTTVSTDDPAYFHKRVDAEAASCRENGLRASVAVLRLAPGVISATPAKELRELALALIREYDLVLLGRYFVGVLLAETDETGIRAFLRRFAEGWKRTPAPIVQFQTIDGQEGSLPAARQLVQAAWAEDAAA